MTQWMQKTPNAWLFGVAALAVICALFGTSNTVAAKVPQSWQDDATLRDVHFVDAQLGWAAGDHGVVWHTENGGEIWHAQNTPTASQLSTIFFADQLNGFAAGGRVKPLTGQSVGELLRTTDGGKTWRPIPGLLLPWITKIHFIDAKRGFAVGMSSALYPSGAWKTNDSGMTWTPIMGVTGENWSRGSFDGSTGLLLSRSGAAAWLSNNRLIKTNPATDWLCSRGDVSLLNRGVAFHASSSVSVSPDSGQTWQRNVVQSAVDALGVHASAICPGQVWLAGAVGSRILKSDDIGNTWKAVPTTATLPIHSLRFLSDTHGWAVGSKGLILSTKDGGVTWQQQRGGAKRAAMVGVFADVDSIPWDLLTQAAAHDAYRVHVVLLAEDASGPLRCDREKQLQDAAMRIGATAEVLTRLPLDTDVDVTATQLLKSWHTVDPRASDRLAAKLTQLIRVHRPDVLLTSDERDTGAQKLLARLLQDAAEYASSTAFPVQIEQLGLQPWPVARVLTVRASSGKAPALDTLATDLGNSVADLARRSQQIMGIQPKYSESSWSLFSLIDKEQSNVGRHPLSGLALQYESAPRRARTIRKVTDKNKNLAALRRTRLIVATEKIVGRGSQRLEQMERLLSQEPELLGDELFHLAGKEARLGNKEEAELVLRHLVTRHQDHPLSDAVLVRLMHYHSSVERMWQQHKANQAALPETSAVQLASAELPVAEDSSDALPAVANAAVERAEKFEVDTQSAFQLAREIKSKRPRLYSQPSVGFPIASVTRIAGQLPAAKGIFRAQSTLPPTSTWRGHALRELGLVDPDSKEVPTSWECHRIQERPHLDGELSDAAWQGASITSLTCGNEVAPTQIVLAYDDEHLYVAASCPRRANTTYLPVRRPRPRDANLDEMDRLQILLDINRDYTSWWSIEIDHRGWTRDSLMTDPRWNPKYFVASSADESAWTVEVAIPLDELAPEAIRKASSWAIGVKRIVPEVAVEKWAPTSSTAHSPNLQGLLRLE